MKIEGHSGKVKAVLELIKDGDNYKCSGEFIYKIGDNEIKGKVARIVGEISFLNDWKIEIEIDEWNKFGRNLKMNKIKEALEKIFLDGKRLLLYKMEMENLF